MKIQELLNKYKDNLFHKDVSEIEYINWIVFGYELDGKRLMPHTKFSLSDLLFSTPFLSLLEWDDNKCDKVWTHQYMKWWKFVEWYSIYEQYHKINLVLLNTDEERISYLENNTI